MRAAKTTFSTKSILALITILLLCTPAFALTPEINSIEPNHGTNDSPTDITVHGSNFEATPRVALYGGGSNIIGAADTPANAVGVFVSGNYAYVADSSSGLQVIDVSDPESPNIVGSADTLNAEGVYVSGNYAYVADSSSGLQVIDISDPTSPNIVGSADTPGYARDVFVSGNYAYVADGNSGLQVIDVSDPESPTIVGSADTPGNAYDVHVSGNYAYVAVFEPGLNLKVIDISDPTNPTVVGSVDTFGSIFSGAKGVYVSGNYAYVADGDYGLQVIDVSDPTNPTVVGSADTPGYAMDVYVSGNYAYVADGSGLQIIDITGPTNPTVVGSADTLGSALRVHVSGNYAYVGGLQVLRAFEPCSNITLVDSTTLTATVPPGLPIGTYNLHVTNPNTERAILLNSFTVADDILTLTCSTGKEIGIQVESGGDLVSITAVDPATIPESSGKPDNLPYGLLDLMIKADAVGGTAKVTFYLESPAGNNDKWSKHKTSTGKWEDCGAYASFNAARDRVTLTLVDGGDGDDGPADGWIVDPSGLNASVSASTSSGGGGGGCFIQTLGL